jgi:hypothetical protein
VNPWPLGPGQAPNDPAGVPVLPTSTYREERFERI